MHNRYLFLLNNNFTGEKFLFELFNISDDPRYYRFDIEIPDAMKYGEYDWFLLHCELKYEFEFSRNIIDSKITVTDRDGAESTWALRDLYAESGILSYEPDSEDYPYESLDIDNDRVDVTVH